MEQKMIRIAFCTFALVALCSAAFNYPTYSLDKMPSTKFTCRDKILGGYYADAETQCQMFHVCVKVAGVGVQDFRFLCPNGTAFDQEAQTCADWGDVDCESATLYYGSDNFDLYRVGSGFESKRAPFPDEEEATFHLQRAETSDSRRSKQVVINQKTKVQHQPTPNYHTTNSHVHSFNKIQTFDKTTSRYQPNHLQSSSSARPSTPTPPRPTTTSTTSTTSTTTTSTTTPAPPSPFVPAQQQQFNGQQMNYQEAIRQQSSAPAQNYNPYATYNSNNNNNAQSTRLNAYPSSTTIRPSPQQSRQSYTPSSTSTPIIQYSLSDDIFRGSYSSNFFNNKNNGKEDFETEQVDTKKKPTTTTKATQKPAVYRGRITSRGRVTYNSSQRGNNNNGQRQSNFNVIGNSQKPTTYQTTTTARPTPAPVTQNVNGRNYNNIRTNPQRAQTQPQTSNVTPVTYRPSTISSSSFRVPVTKTTAPPSTASPLNPEDQFYDVPRKVPAKAVTPINFLPTTVKPSSLDLQPQHSFSFSKFNPNANYELTAVQQSKFTYNPYGEPRVSPSAESSTSSYFPTTTTTTTTSPAPSTTKAPFYPTPAPVAHSSPRGFETIPITLQPQSIQRSSQQQQQRPQPFSRRSDSKSYTPSSTKKFSTLVPRELYDPTTFKPATYKKAVDNLAAIKSAQYDQQAKQSISKYTPTNFVTSPPTISTSTTTTTTVRPTPAFNNYSPVQNSFQSTQNPFNSFPQNANTFNAPSAPFQPSAAALVQTQKTSDNSFPSKASQQVYSTAAPSYNNNFQAFNQLQVSSASSAAAATPQEIDEDDGQYHPELYEKDFARYKIKNKKASKIVSPAQYYQSSTAPSRQSVGVRTHFQKPVVVASSASQGSSGEEEFLKTAHSQNIVASGNQLLYDSLKTGFKQQQQQSTTAVQQKTQSTVASPRPFSKTAPTIPPNATSTKRPVKAKAEKDVSYDYQYYDFGVDGGQRDYEFDLLEDFGKLKKTTKGKKQ